MLWSKTERRLSISGILIHSSHLLYISATTQSTDSSSQVHCKFASYTNSKTYATHWRLSGSGGTIWLTCCRGQHEPRHRYGLVLLLQPESKTIVIFANVQHDLVRTGNGFCRVVSGVSQCRFSYDGECLDKAWIPQDFFSLCSRLVPCGKSLFALQVARLDQNAREPYWLYFDEQDNKFVENNPLQGWGMEESVGAIYNDTRYEPSHCHIASEVLATPMRNSAYVYLIPRCMILH